MIGANYSIQPARQGEAMHPEARGIFRAGIRAVRQVPHNETIPAGTNSEGDGFLFHCIGQPGLPFLPPGPRTGYWFIVAKNSSLPEVIVICFWRNSIASTVVISERYLRSTHVRFITSRDRSRSSRRVPEAITSTAG